MENHGKDKAEQLEKQNKLRRIELHLYYTYRDEALLNMENIPRDIFYNSYQDTDTNSKKQKILWNSKK